MAAYTESNDPTRGMSAPSTVSVCVVDDERLAREGLADLLSADPEIDVVAICASGSAAVSAITELRPDVVFLDVRMPEMNGFDVVRAVGVEKMPLVVFTTAYDSYAVDAFQANAVEYLLKPFSDDRLADAVARAKSALKQRHFAKLGKNLLDLLERAPLAGAQKAERHLERIVVRNGGDTIFVSASDVDWIEGADYYAKVHATGKRHLVRESLNSLASRLDPAAFFRAHRSAIVNVTRVREIQSTFGRQSVAILEDGTKVRLAKGKRAELESLLEKGAR